jgi:hypothetical protein
MIPRTVPVYSQLKEWLHRFVPVAALSLFPSLMSAQCVTANADGSWVNSSFTSQSGTFTATFDATPSASPTNAVIGLSNGAQTAYGSFACLVRFNTSGTIDAYNATAYQGAATPISYSAGTTYHFRVVVNVGAQTYSSYVTPSGGSEQTIGTGFGFRVAASSLNNVGTFVNASASGGAGSLSMCNFFASSNSGCPSATADGAWNNASFSSQSGTFTATFDATPSASPTNAVVALSNGAQTAYGSFSCLVRFNTSGTIDAYNGTAYQGPGTPIGYSGGSSYHFRVVVNIGAQTYSAYVTAPGGTEKTIGTGFAFRVGNTTLNNRGIYVAPAASGGVGSLSVCNFSVSTSAGQVSTPVFSPAPGSYSSAQSVSITTATSGASIRYTTDGSTPSSTAGTLYSGPVSIGATTTLKAIAYASGLTNSAVASGTYTIGSTTNYSASQVLAGVKAHMTSSTQVNTSPHINTMTRQMNVNVFQVTSGVFAYTSSMAIDTDGVDPDPDPDHQNQTTWQDDNGSSLGAHRVPYYVLGDYCYDKVSPCPHFYYAEHNITGLQFALIFYNGNCIGAVFGDTQGDSVTPTSDNDSRELGEASVHSADLLGIPSSGTTGGVSNGVTVVIFSGSAWVVHGTNDTLSSNAQALVQKALNTLGAKWNL